MTQRRPPRPKRPCPTCKAFPGIYCAACRGTGHTPKMRMDMKDRDGKLLVEPGKFKWDGIYKGRWISLRSSKLLPDGYDVDTVNGPRGDAIPVTVKRSTTDTEQDARQREIAGFFTDVNGFTVTDGTDGGDEMDEVVMVTDLDLGAVRDYVGIHQVEFDAVAKRKSRKPLDNVMRAERHRVARRFAEVLDEAYRHGKRTGAMKVLCAAYDTSDVVLGKLRREGRLA